MTDIQSPIRDAKDAVKNAVHNVVPTPPQQPQKSQSDVHELKGRLEWGEPALTILDVSDRETYNKAHILGAMTMPLDSLVEKARPTIDSTRDIYVYGPTEETTTNAANQLRAAGFECVYELKGGLAAWKAVAGPTEGVDEATDQPPSSAYNVVSQLKHHQDTQNAAR
ncbi:rhodanese-like domain-containing protein [Leptolyngbya sp. FACHB-261]|uniref:rhodanese-like domain-containing protein n=1 Tax=Leptolyngbya sp. FACHB-261 TaxID=2692806 RepID=UPI001683C4AA|nr:rhodanese-like domain-containing protein [Leptolyngbya sp. FACHB-261]MBD2100654.1 rhodanese-like domain-containing protein [Leptolyngbya sp. FACHB-261]